jgi:exonuclease III
MRVHPLKILQYNVRKEKRGVLVPLLEDKEVQDIDILAIQEPWYNDRTQTSYSIASNKFHLLHRGGAGVRTCFYVNKRMKRENWEVEYLSDDHCSLQVKCGLETPVWIHNVYNPSPPSTSSTDIPPAIPLLREAMACPGEHIIVGDFNLHHPYWNNKGRLTYHTAADYLLDALAKEQMELTLPKDSVTWRGRGYESTIDLVFMSPGAYNAMVRCGTREDLQVGSDHIPILTEMEWTWEEREITPRRAWKKTREEKTKEEIRKGARALGYALGFPDINTEQQANAYLDKMRNGFQEIIEETVPWAKLSEHSRPFWNDKCTKVTRTAKACLREYHHCRTDKAREDLRLAERDKVATIQRASTLAFREGVHKASMSSAGVWKLAKWGREKSMLPREVPKFPALKTRTGQKTQTFEGKVETLRRVFFPPPTPANLTNIEGTEYLSPISINKNISAKEVLEAIYRPLADKAPGPNGIPNRFLRAVAGVLQDHFRHLFQACLTLGHHPRHFKIAKTVVLKKPNKADYSEPKAYRSIALLDTLGKVFETIIAKRLSFLAERYHLLPDQQMGARKNRSVETALDTIIEAVHTVWGQSKDNVASLLSLDAMGAFDRVTHPRLLHNLRQRKIPETYVHWIASFLTERATSIVIGDQESPVQPAETGIPQGSPISPVLFLFFNAPLLKDCAKANLPVQTGGFVDDIHLLAYSRSTERNCEVLGKAHDICLKWASRHGAAFAPQKYELIHLSRRSKQANIDMAINFRDTIIEPKASMRILGLYIDPKLKWGPHLAQVKAKMASQGRALSCLAGSTWGATFQKARTVYSMVVRPMMTFAAPVWHNPKSTSEFTAKHTRQLAVAQNSCLRTVLGAYQATPVQLLEAEALIPPIQLQLDRLVMRSQALRGTHPLVQKNNVTIRNRLRKGRGQRKKPPPTPAQEKEAWALRSLGVESWDEAATAQRQKKNCANPATNTKKWQEVQNVARRIDAWWYKRLSGRWEHYQRQVPDWKKFPAQTGDWHSNRFDLHAGLQKAESSAAVQLRTGKIGFNSFLFKIKVPGIDTPGCSCGWAKQDTKHILLFCPDYTAGRQELIQQAGTSDLRHMLTSTEGVRAAARWLVRSGVLTQFSLAKIQLARADRRESYKRTASMGQINKL